MKRKSEGERTLNAVDKSIRHWEENLAMLEKWKGLGVRRTLKCFSVVYSGDDGKEESFGWRSDDCPLCLMFLVSEGRCGNCPLCAVGDRCEGHSSSWMKFALSTTINGDIRCAKRLIASLVRAREFVEKKKKQKKKKDSNR